MRCRVRRVEIDIARFDEEVTAVRHRIACVHRQVDHDLFDLAGIRGDLTNGAPLHHERDVPANKPAQQVLHTAEHLIDVEDLRLDHPTATECAIAV